MKILWIVIVFIGLLKPSVQRSSPTDDSYVAAVLEYAFVTNATVNLENYLKYITDAASQNADIVVFPELTLRSRSQIPINGDLRQYPIPYLNASLYDPVLVSLSRTAADNQIYVLVNLEELVDCTDNRQSELCPESKVYYFNTNVVFDRNGAVIDRFRKINLFGEYTRTPALNPDLGVFTTDFGVTFGHFICFDLMFQVPAVQVVQKLNITDVIFSTMWFSELPYLTAVQIDQAYAYTLNVNMLVSGANNVRVGSAGSGIFSGRAGALVSTMPGVATTSLLVARVPKIPGQINSLATTPSDANQINSVTGQIAGRPEDSDQLYLIKDPSIPSHVTRLLVDGFQEFVLSDKDVSCVFRVNMTHGRTETGPRFRAVTRDGVNKYVHREAAVVSCAVIACATDDVKSCGSGYGLETETYFESLEIQMLSYRLHYNTTLHCDNILYFPTTLQTNILAFAPKDFTYTSNTIKRKQHLYMKLNSRKRDLLTFGIWGRIYTRDVNKEHTVTEEEKEKFALFEEERYRYRAAVMDGIRSFSGMATGGIRVCSVIECVTDDLDSCGDRFPQYLEGRTATFSELSITATVPTPKWQTDIGAYDTFYVPVSVDTSLQTLQPEEFTFIVTQNGENTTHFLSLNSFSRELYSIAVWGRLYERDGQDATPPRSSSVMQNSGVLGLVLGLLFVINQELA